jgi:deoxyribodipyrimidine photo-lyase
VRTIVWFRGKDLRLSDHAPLSDAVASGDVIPLFVLDPYYFAPERAREIPHRMQFLLDSLSALEAGVARLGSRLLVVPGRSVEIVPRLFAEWKADRVAAHRWVDPIGRERDRRIAAVLGERLALYEGETLAPAGTLRTQGGKPFAVFSQFARAFAREAAIGKALRAPRSLPPLPAGLSCETAPIPGCEKLGLVRNPAVLEGGERAAHGRLRRFLEGPLAGYAEGRDRMDLAATSRLSADLKFGTISVREVWTAVSDASGGTPSARAFQNELVWREFAHSTLWDRPDVLERPFRSAFAEFPWVEDEPMWQAWVRGRTGYPLVDASARQLLAEGFVPNRARMISASFLTKHLRIDYRRGEAHYAKFLTDGDPAQNNLNWQWAAGSGCDAQPYFRIFNPVTQGEKFDPLGDYVRRFLPELARVPARFIHRPWEAPGAVLSEAGVRMGDQYPRPVVDHRLARERYLDAAARHLTGP